MSCSLELSMKKFMTMGHVPYMNAIIISASRHDASCITRFI